MDNFMMDVTAEGDRTLERIMAIAFEHNGSPQGAPSYEVVKFGTGVHGLPADLEGRTALVLRWIERDRGCRPDAVDLPFRLDPLGAADFARRWLAEQDYGPEPGHDGSNRKGWRVHVGPWGHVGGDHYAICAVIPAWAMLGK